MGFPGDSVVNNLHFNARGTGDGWIPGSGRSPGGGNANPLQHSCLENPMKRRAWRTTVHGVIKSRSQLSMHTPNHLGGFDFRSCGQECLDDKRFKEMIDVIRLA